MDCKLLRAHLDAYVDGELEPTPVIEFEQHLDACPACRNELALGRLLEQGVRGLSGPPAPDGLRRRVVRALDKASVAEGRGGGPWVGVLAVAASVALAAGALLRSDGTARSAREMDAAADPAPLGVLGEIVARHVDQLPADIAAERPEQVTSWSRGKVGFRVRSVEFSEPQVHLLGARVSHVWAQPAIKLYYSVGDSALTTVLFQTSPALEHVLHDDQLMARSGGHRQRFGSRVVTYHNVHGYTVPILEHDGIAYAFTGDLDQRHLLQLVASARLP
jgi:anti-sigma factor (TIGR02949 family)